MKIVSISWVRNEADVIETFVRHHCAFLDHMILIDNRSTDNTREILSKLKEEGLPLDLRIDDSFAHLQGEALTAVLGELRGNAPDYVLPLDADEFLWTNEGENVRMALEKLPTDIASLVRWHTYVPMPGDDPAECNVLKRVRQRRAIERPQWFKVIIPKKLLLGTMKLRMGSHALVDETSNRNAEHCESSSLFLGHFPVRSPDQIAGKVFGGWLSQMANPLRAKGAIFQWKAIFDELKSGKEIDPEMLMRLAMDYGTEKQWHALPAEEKDGKSLGHFAGTDAQASSVGNATAPDPIPANFALKYPAHRLPPIRILAESAEYLAQEVAKNICVVQKRNKEITL